MIYVEAGDDKTILACIEEGLQHGGLGAVVGEIARLSMTASQRLQLAAERAGTIGIALRGWWRQTEATDFGQPTAAMTRTHLSGPINTAAGAGRIDGSNWSAPERAIVLISSWRRAMTRVVSVFPPTWSTDRLRRKAGGRCCRPGFRPVSGYARDEGAGAGVRLDRAGTPPFGGR